MHAQCLAFVVWIPQILLFNLHVAVVFFDHFFFLFVSYSSNRSHSNHTHFAQHVKNSLMYLCYSSIFFSLFLFVCYAERRYGCYRLGVFASIIIVLLLILGTIPVTLTVKNNQILLICLCSTLVVVTILLSLFIVWQQKQAKRQRERSTRPFIMQKQNKVKKIKLNLNNINLHPHLIQLIAQSETKRFKFIRKAFISI